MCPSAVPREIAVGIVQLEERLGPRRLQLYALADEGGWLLFDAGIPGSVTSRLERGELREGVRTIVVSHADADHLGDVAGVCLRFADADVVCDWDERRWVEDHQALVRERYDHARDRLGFGYTADVLDGVRDLCGTTRRCPGRGRWRPAARRRSQVGGMSRGTAPATLRCGPPRSAFSPRRRGARIRAAG